MQNWPMAKLLLTYSAQALCSTQWEVPGMNKTLHQPWEWVSPRICKRPRGKIERVLGSRAKEVNLANASELNPRAC